MPRTIRLLTIVHNVIGGAAVSKAEKFGYYPIRTIRLHPYVYRRYNAGTPNMREWTITLTRLVYITYTTIVSYSDYGCEDATRRCHS